VRREILVLLQGTLVAASVVVSTFGVEVVIPYCSERSVAQLRATGACECESHIGQTRTNSVPITVTEDR